MIKMKIKIKNNGKIEFADLILIENGKTLSQGSIKTFNLETKQIEKKECIVKFYDVSLVLKDGAKYEIEETDDLESILDNFNKLLPENIKLICCNTCRFGHANPIGGMLLCLIDDGEITSKDDILKLFECKAQEFGKTGKCKKFCQKEESDFCDRYEECSEKYYRYK
jgi:hypothetical protein